MVDYDQCQRRPGRDTMPALLFTRLSMRIEDGRASEERERGSDALSDALSETSRFLIARGDGRRGLLAGNRRERRQG